MLPLTFDWLNTYNFGIGGNVVGGGVRVDLTQADFSAGEDIPWRTIYIDNTQVPFELELVFPDSGQTITVRPLSEKTARIYSSSNYCTVYFIYDNGSGFTYSNTLPNLQSQNMTFICFDTEDTSPSTDNLTFLRSSATKALQVPAAADQLISGGVALNNAVGTRTSILTVPANNSPTYNLQSERTLVINAIDIAFVLNNAAAQTLAVSLIWHQNLPSIDIATVGTWSAVMPAPIYDFTIVRLTSLQLEYDIGQHSAFSLQFNNLSNVAGASLQYTIAYTICTYP